MKTNSRLGNVTPAFEREIDVMITRTGPMNFRIVESQGWDLGAAIGDGYTVREAIKDFIEDWLLKFDEYIKVKVTAWPNEKQSLGNFIGLRQFTNWERGGLRL